jgi:hypothetical protein
VKFSDKGRIAMKARFLAPAIAALLLGAAAGPVAAHGGTGDDHARGGQAVQVSGSTSGLGLGSLFQARGNTVFTLGILRPVPTNHVHGAGTATVHLGSDNRARIMVNAAGLLNEAPHAMHIHVKGNGECPVAADAGLHNGYRSMSTTDGLPAYGPIGTSLTTSGDTSPASALAVDRFPSSGSFHYSRTIQLTSDVAEQVRHHNAVVVVHGIDYNGNGRYDNVLGPSELNPAFPMEATAPALCGPLN